MKKFFKKAVIGLGTCALLAGAYVAVASDPGHDGGHIVTATPNSTMKMVIQGNDAFKHTYNREHFEPFQNGQVPNLTVITCADSRVHTQLFDFQADNNIFIIRNVGNQIQNSEGSVDYGVRHLPTKVLLVLGHSSCGAVKAAMGDYSGETPGIKEELDTLQPSMAMDDGSGPFNHRWAQNVERNVDAQVAYGLELYKDKVAAGELAVVGAVYDFNNLWGKDFGSLIVVNINGETDVNKIMGHPVLNELSKAEIVTHVGSRAK